MNRTGGRISALLSITFLLLAAESAQAQNVTLSVSGIRSPKGTICVSVFRNEAGFKENKPVSRLKFAKTDLVQGKLTLSLQLAQGIYGIALLDDENGNGKMDNNMVGMPKEGFGFSNFYLSGLSRPSFNDFRFDVTAAAVNLTSKLRYL